MTFSAKIFLVFVVIYLLHFLTLPLQVHYADKYAGRPGALIWSGIKTLFVLLFIFGGFKFYAIIGENLLNLR